jgi:hypothetical protein
VPGDTPNYGNPHVTVERWNDSQYGAAFYLFTREPRAFEYVIREGLDMEGAPQRVRDLEHGRGDPHQGGDGLVQPRLRTGERPHRRRCR